MTSQVEVRAWRDDEEHMAPAFGDGSVLGQGAAG
jgi:hypothetical protein